MAFFRCYTSVIGTEENYKNFVHGSQYVGLLHVHDLYCYATTFSAFLRLLSLWKDR